VERFAVQGDHYPYMLCSDFPTARAHATQRWICVTDLKS
jgi:hypothetical protein